MASSTVVAVVQISRVWPSIVSVSSRPRSSTICDPSESAESADGATVSCSPTTMPAASSAPCTEPDIVETSCATPSTLTVTVLVRPAITAQPIARIATSAAAPISTGLRQRLPDDPPAARTGGTGGASTGSSAASCRPDALWVSSAASPADQRSRTSPARGS